MINEIPPSCNGWHSMMSYYNGFYEDIKRVGMVIALVILCLTLYNLFTGINANTIIPIAA